jgi:Flp pilus assembly protein TadD
MFLGEMHYRLNDLQGALWDFSESVKFNRKNIEARKNVGFLLALLGRRAEAIQADLKALELAPRDALLLSRLSLLYFSSGDYNTSLSFARRAYDAAPAAEKRGFDTFLESLQDQAK